MAEEKGEGGAGGGAAAAVGEGGQESDEGIGDE